MEYLDLGLRGAAVALFAVISCLMLMSRVSLEGRLSILAVSATQTALMLLTTAIALPLHPVLAGNLALIGSLTPTAITWLIVTVFLDPPWRRWPWLAVSFLISIAFYFHFVAPAFSTICALVAIPFYAALLGLAIWSARDDLVECRCRARPAFAGAIAGLAMLFTGLQVLDPPADMVPVFELIKSAGTVAVTFAFAIWILRPDMALWPGPQDQPARPRHESGPQPDAQHADAALAGRVREAMEAGIWREEGLTIGALASRLSVPEHRLRRAINQGLGHRNFSSFINAARIEEAQRLLDDPQETGTTVLEIAYRVGFASLGPFNRAFRSETGMSPTEYRRRVALPRS